MAVFNLCSGSAMVFQRVRNFSPNVRLWNHMREQCSASHSMRFDQMSASLCRQARHMPQAPVHSARLRSPRSDTGWYPRFTGETHCPCARLNPPASVPPLRVRRGNQDGRWHDQFGRPVAAARLDLASLHPVISGWAGSPGPLLADWHRTPASTSPGSRPAQLRRPGRRLLRISSTCGPADRATEGCQRKMARASSRDVRPLLDSPTIHQTKPESREERMERFKGKVSLISGGARGQ